VAKPKRNTHIQTSVSGH